MYAFSLLDSNTTCKLSAQHGVLQTPSPANSSAALSKRRLVQGFVVQESCVKAITQQNLCGLFFLRDCAADDDADAPVSLLACREQPSGTR